MLGSEHIFGVYVVTFDTWHLAILFDWVQGIMLVSQGTVLIPGNEGSMAESVYVYLFPQLYFICVHMPISELPFWCNSCTCPPPWDNRCAERKPAVWIWNWIVLGIARVLCEGVFFFFFVGKCRPWLGARLWE